MRFETKVIVITGAASGLGKATAIMLSAEKARLLLVDRDEQALSDLSSALNRPGDVMTICADVSEEAQVKAYVGAAMEAHGRIDGFLNNAGIEGRRNVTEDFGADEFDRVLSVNLKGVFYGLAHVLPVMRQQGGGSIVNMASVGGIRGVGNQSGYAASKHGVVGLTRNSAVEYGQFGIQINAVAPGAIMTPIMEGSLRQRAGEDWQQAGMELAKSNPMGRFGKPEEVAALVAFLLSGAAGYINGAVIAIDGGQSAKY